MKVLFVSSGNKLLDINPIVRNQGDSLKKNGIEIEYFKIVGRGAVGYLKNIFKLKRFLKKNRFDMVHAHYSLSGYVAALAGGPPLVVSLMGSDAQRGMFSKGIIWLFNKFFWCAMIVKSESMKQKINIQNTKVIPNGVNFEIFEQKDKKNARENVGFYSKNNIIFVADPHRKEKNHELAFKAVKELNDADVKLNVVSDVAYERIPYYYRAADVLLLTSLWEGSPNVVKEAMACNLPIVATDVGDVKEVIGDTEGCYVTSFDPADVSEKLSLALKFGKRTDGREKIKHLDSNVIAQKLISVYEEILEKRKH